MDKKEYIIRQLGRTKNKKYEAYVVSRIIHCLDDFSVKFITQQYVNRPEGRALTDLFFPQFGLHIEVDEGQHFSENAIIEDKIREQDIINATGHEILRVDVTKTFDDINAQITTVVERIKSLKLNSNFTDWDIDAEFNPETYIELGYISTSDNVAFKTIKDACNCFGHNYSGYQRAGAPHPHHSDTILWFPKLFPNGMWNNSISNDECTIVENHEQIEEARKHVSMHLENKEKYKHKRVVFAKVKGNLGDVLYRFRGLYELDVDASNHQDGLVWKRSKSKVETYRHI